MKNKEQIKNELMIIRGEIENYKSKLDQLKEHDVVKQFIQTTNELKELKSVESNLDWRYKVNCNHPIYFLQYSEYCKINDVTIWGCKCLDCGKYSEKLSTEFNNVITSGYKLTYEAIKEVYNELATNEYGSNVPVKVLTKELNKTINNN